LAYTGCAASSFPPNSQTIPATAPANATSGRSQCPGAAPVAVTNLDGPAAHALEQLQTTYERQPGFLAVVFDGQEPTLVVDARLLPVWQLKLGPKGVAVAPSCIDTTVLAAVKAALPAVAPSDGVVSVGYDALSDAINIVGIDSDTLLVALARSDPAMRDRARPRSVRARYESTGGRCQARAEPQSEWPAGSARSVDSRWAGRSTATRTEGDLPWPEESSLTPNGVIHLGDGRSPETRVVRLTRRTPVQVPATHSASRRSMIPSRRGPSRSG
jgi:hypothetical protein